MKVWATGLLLVGAVAVTAAGPDSKKPKKQGIAVGTVFEDKNRNGRRDSGEPGLKGIRVSNQADFATTDGQGQWKLPHDEDTIFFVVKPKGWMTLVDHHKLPKFYYIHKPKGSPATFRYLGVRPTGPLPKSIDFPLHRQKEANSFTALFFGDPQPRDFREVEYIAKDIVEPLIGQTQHAFGVTLGDIAFDNLETMEPLNGSIALIGIPWYNVIGNHDMNYEAPDDQDSDETFHRHYGPNYYSFEYGPTHFVVLDDVVWRGLPGEARRVPSYRGGLGPKQLAWLKKDLELVPQNQLVVLMMHIPLNAIDDRQEVFRLIEKRPYCLSVAAHEHYQEHRFIKTEDGWRGAKPHHHLVNVTACGSWWQGSPDIRGVPHTTMRDGSPHGYSIFTFTGNQYSIEFRAARRAAAYQMNVIAPDSSPIQDIPGMPVYVNVFGGNEYSKVEMSFAGGNWVQMTKTLEPDPFYKSLVEKDKSLTRPFRPLPAPINSPHLWKSNLQSIREPGVYPIHVRTTDMFGQVYVTTKAIRVDPMP